MTPKKLLLTVLLLGLLSEGTAELQYALTIPVRLNSGEIGKACVNLLCFENFLDLNVVLQYGEINTTIFNELVSPPKYFQCNTFTVPVVIEDVPVIVLLSVSGVNVDILRRYNVVITVPSNIYLVQMDKPIYKTGQKVLFNVVSLDQNLLPVNETYPEVYLTDPSGSRIAQWLNSKAEGGLATFEYDLVDDANSGYYYVTALRASDYAVTQWFTVEEYVPPRFSVTLDALSTLSILDETCPFNISARYTYGEPVPGTVSIKWCREPTYGRFNNCFKDKYGVCFYEKAQLDSDGTYHGEINLTSIQMDISGFSTNLNLSVTVTENGTEIQVTQTQYFWVTTQLARIAFDYEHMCQYYKRGLPYHVTLFLLDENSQPIVGEEVEIEVDGDWEIRRITTDSNGAANCDIDTSNFFQPNFTIRASYPNTEQCYLAYWQGPDYPTADFLVFRFYSVNGNFLQIIAPPGTLRCGSNQSIEVQFLLSSAGICDGASTATFYYLTMSRARIIHSGQKDVNLTYAMNGTFSFELPITPEMAFKTDLVVYSMPQKEIISDIKSLNVENCFKNEVSLSFSEESGPPASNVSLKISASPGSLCAVKVIDSSILLLNPDTGLTPETNIGLVVGTDATVRKPEVCRPYVATYPGPVLTESGGISPPDSVAQKVIPTTETTDKMRTNFTDTWIWKMINVNHDGNGTISEIAPDTITEWKGSMICTSETDGFGMTKNLASFITILPFFVDMSLPYSFIRGEILVLTASVSNYLAECVKVQVTLWSSGDYVATVQDVEQDKCICSGDKAYYTWNINAIVVGVTNFTISAETTYICETCDGEINSSDPVYKDTMSQSIIIEPEGIQKEETSSNLVCLQGNSSEYYTIPVNLVPPPGLVPGSASAFIIIVGDIIGLPMQNLQNLLKMPYGCAEQNLARMAPSPYVLNYLENTHQLTDEFRQLGIQDMNMGYYRQLRYRLPSGAYSLFSGENKEANALVTFYTFKTFESCKKYIYIDGKIQQQTLIWLENLQKLHSGCFRAIGAPFMRWGEAEDNDVILTASIAIGLMESNYSLGMTLLVSAMTCLQNVFDNNHNLSVYHQALMVYAFTLDGDWDRREILLTSLKSKAIEEGGTVHWERDDKPAARPVDFFYRPYSPAEVEITAYIFLAFLLGPNVTDDLPYCAQISVWLIRQQNPYGGFQSTRDTVVALQAISIFAKLIFIPDAHQSIKVTGQETITVNEYNRFLVQRRPLDIPGNYNISINGTGCCLVQTTVRYNVPVPQENSTFLLSANTSSTSCVNGVAYAFPISISVSYRGNRSETNMVVLDIAMLSGYQVDYWSLQELLNSKVIANFEIKNNHVILYLKFVSQETIYCSVNVIMGNRVLNMKHASIYVYDYYEKDENGYTSYHHPCSSP
ncbi:ovostatin-like isoform 2-T3 [Anomaloglossus baeobatrachus]|uniref:ovostatin-like isoform X2 n=1 Tax=Anomaloglossus baeobatrachus TaxID=238106 RepID=UPI003F50881A